MNENSFVVVGRIERLISAADRLTLIIGGAGPVKALVAVQLREAALIKLVSTPGAGFATGDVVSIGGRLEYDPETHQNVAIAAPDRVSRIARASTSAAGAAQAGTSAGSAFFGGARPAPRSAPAAGQNVPPLPQDFPMHVEGDLVELGDVPF